MKTRQGIANVFAKFCEDLYEGEEDNTKKGTDSRTENDGEEPDRNNSIKEFTTNDIQDAIDRLKKGKRKTAMEYEPSSKKTAVTIRNAETRKNDQKCATKDDSPFCTDEKENTNREKPIVGESLPMCPVCL